MAKTRFVAKIGGVARRLLTVDENRKGALQVIVDSRGYFNPHLGPDAAVTENRFSIHLSARSVTPGNLAHKTLVFATGQQKHAYVFSQAVANGGFQPLETLTVLDVGDFTPYDPPKTGVYEVGSYDPRSHTMYFAVWFAAADTPLPTVSCCTVLQVAYRRYSLVIPVCFTKLPTPREGMTVNYFTTAPENLTLEQAKAGILPGISTAVPPSLVEAVMIHEFNRLIRGDLAAEFPTGQPIQQVPLFTARPEL